MSKPNRILILGATSAIAQAYARRRAGEHAAFVLVGRHEDRLSAVATDLIARGASSAETISLDLAAIDAIEDAAIMLYSSFRDIDEILIAYGFLGKQIQAEIDWTEARRILDINLTSVAIWVLSLLNRRSHNVPVTMIVIGSVAGDRGRASNFVYGAAKGGLENFLEGLRQKYENSPVRIITIKPGLIDTPMTSGIRKGGLLWAQPDRVATDIHTAVKRGRRVVYTPWFWRPIMLIIRWLPWPLYVRFKLY